MWIDQSISKWIDPVITWNFLNGIRMNYPGYKPGFPHDIWELNYNRDFPEISEKGIDQVTIMYLRNELPDYTMKLSGFWIDLPAEWQWIAQVRIGYWCSVWIMM